MEFTLVELGEINRGLLFRIDFLAKARIDADTHQARRSSEQMRETAIAARQKVKNEIERLKSSDNEDQSVPRLFEIQQFFAGHLFV